MNLVLFFSGLAAPFLGVFLLVWIFSLLTVQVEDEASTLVLKFGSLKKTLKKPGLHFIPSRILPWVSVIDVSLQRDFRNYYDIHINDKNGTTVIVDLWLEFRIKNPEKALFEVEEWEQALKSLVVHSATSILCSKDFLEILTSRNQVSDLIFKDIATEMGRWGIEVNSVLLKNVGLLPDVSRQMLQSVGAKLERAKALIEEKGRLRIERLDSKTDEDVARLNAQAKGQYPLYVGRAYSELMKKPPVFAAYCELYKLGRMNPRKTVFFEGFKEGMDPLTAAMVIPPITKDEVSRNSGNQNSLMS